MAKLYTSAVVSISMIGTRVIGEQSMVAYGEQKLPEQRQPPWPLLLEETEVALSGYQRMDLIAEVAVEFL